MASVGSLFALQIWQRALGNPLLLFLSLISYNLYLWHQTIAQILLRAHIPPFAGTDPHLDRDWMWHFSLVAYLAAVAVATVITYALERPLLKRRPFEELFEPRDPAPLDLAPSLPAPVVAEAD
jgi:peptidoglycan/LPS O-acetylase OafA/YrhL